MGDWIVYYEFWKVVVICGYFVVVKVESVIFDLKVFGMYLVLIKYGSYFDFINFVLFSGLDGVIE